MSEYTYNWTLQISGNIAGYCWDLSESGHNVARGLTTTSDRATAGAAMERCAKAFVAGTPEFAWDHESGSRILLGEEVVGYAVSESGGANQRANHDRTERLIRLLEGMPFTREGDTIVWHA